MSSFYTDPALTTTVVDDFTPGIIRFGRGSYPSSNPATAVLGSATNAYRCYSIPRVGLAPFPAYNLVSQFGTGSGTTLPTSYITCASIRCLGTDAPTPYGTGAMVNYDHVVLAATIRHDDGTSFLVIWHNRLSAPAASYLVYVGPTTTAAPYVWSNLSVVLNNTEIQQGWQQGVTGSTPAGTPASPYVDWLRSCAIFDNISYGPFGATIAGYMVYVPGPRVLSPHNQSDTALVGDTGVGLLHPIIVNPPVSTAYHSYRTVALFTAEENADTNGLATFSAAAYVPTDLFTYTYTADQGYRADGSQVATTAPSVIFPELGSMFGSWGSISTGEFFVVFTQQGAAIIEGDVAAPTSVTKLPGVTGTGTAVGPGVQSPAGFIYATSNDGAYIWTGGNTSQKISGQIPDESLVRALPPAGVPAIYGPCTTHNDQWLNWAMFANNWTFDTTTDSWWQCQNPAVLNFDVHCASANNQFFYSVPAGFRVGTGSGQQVLSLYQWNRDVPAASYVWFSNPMVVAEPGSMVSLQSVEVKVTAPSASTVIVTPIPSGDPSATATTTAGGTLGGPTGDIYTTPPANAITFSIPASVSGYSASARMGWNDSAISLRVDCFSNNFSSPAPILHQIIVGTTSTKTSAVL